MFWFNIGDERNLIRSARRRMFWLCFIFFATLCSSNQFFKVLNSSITTLTGKGYDDMMNYSPEYFPGSRSGACSWTINHRHWLGGGEGFSEYGQEGCLGDLWEFNSFIDQWRFVRGARTTGSIDGNIDEYEVFSFDYIPSSTVTCAYWVEENSLFKHGGMIYDVTLSKSITRLMYEFDPTCGNYTTCEVFERFNETECGCSYSFFCTNTSSPNCDGNPDCYNETIVVNTTICNNTICNTTLEEVNRTCINTTLKMNCSTCYIPYDETICRYPTCGQGKEALLNDSNYGAWRVPVYPHDRLYSNEFGPDVYPYFIQYHTAVPLETKPSVLFFGGMSFNKYQMHNSIWEWNTNKTSPYFHMFRWVSGGPVLDDEGNEDFDFDDYTRGITTSFVKGNRGEFSKENNPPVRYSQSAWSFENYMFVFGGIFSQMNVDDEPIDQYLNDLWVWNHEIEEWAYLSGSTIWVNGEYDPTGEYTDQPPEIHTLGTFDKSNYPGARAYGMVWEAYRGRSFVLFGGRNQDGMLFDIWVYSPIRDSWKVVNGTSEEEFFTTDTTLGNRIVGALFSIMEQPKEEDMEDTTNKVMYNGTRVVVFSGKGPDESGTSYPLLDFYEFTERQHECRGHGDFSYTGSLPSDLTCESVVYNCSYYFPFSSTLENENETCECDDYSLYWGEACEYWTCGGILNNDTTVCGNLHGECVDVDHCECHEGVSGGNCTEWTCFGILTHNESFVCSGHGECRNPDYCTCDKNYTGDQCHLWECFGVYHEDSHVCSYRGICSGEDNCTCKNNQSTPNIIFSGHNCQTITGNMKCFSFLWNDTDNVCGGRGECVFPNTCNCDEKYEGDQCSVYDCFGISKDDISGDNPVCSGKGECINYDICVCNQTNNDFHGSECQEFVDPDQVVDFYVEDHEISIHWQIPIILAQKLGEEFECEEVILNHEVLGGETAVCSWDFGLHNTYILNILLENGDYSAEEITHLQIHSVSKESDNMTLYINTIYPEEDDGDGEEPENATSYGYFGLFAFGFVFPIIFLAGVLCLLICCVCCCLICIFPFLLCVTLITRKKKNVSSRLSKLRHKDILMAEQVKQRGSKSGFKIGKLSVSKKMFEIDFDTVKIEEEIGQGGSGSTVWKARWKSQFVAFKVFKESDLTEENIQEFEREVSILTSVLHPNILKFYGCSSKLSRMGIVTDFCENGDIKQYIMDNPNCFTYLKKLLLLQQIGSAVAYLHDRNVVHLDLKPRNILLKKDFTPKLIDFGISEIIRENQSETRLSSSGSKSSSGSRSSSGGRKSTSSHSSSGRKSSHQHHRRKKDASKAGRRMSLSAPVSPVTTTKEEGEGEGGGGGEKEESPKSTFNQKGTSQYMAPEVTMGKFTKLSDVFSYGITMLEIISEDFDPYGTDLEFVKHLELRVASDPNLRPNIDMSKMYSQGDICSLIQECWDGDPDERPSMTDVTNRLKEMILEKKKDGFEVEDGFSGFHKIYDDDKKKKEEKQEEQEQEGEEEEEEEEEEINTFQKKIEENDKEEEVEKKKKEEEEEEEEVENILEHLSDGDMEEWIEAEN